MSEVFLCKTGQLGQTARRDLRKAGVVVVEVEDPAACQFIRSTEVVSADDMLWAALDALSARGQYSKNGGLNTSADHETKMDRLARNLLHIVVEQRHQLREVAA